MRRRATAFFLLALMACGDDGDSDGADGNTTLDGGDFVFATEPPTAYTRVDRTGMPAVNVALIGGEARKDAYNAADPGDDESGAFVEDLTASVTGLHASLDDALVELALTPCAPADCLAQAQPLVVPDALSIDPSAPAGFPNGRQPADTVMDLTLAVLLLDLDVHAVTTFADVPLNPTANDMPFETAFPYFAPPHMP
jgi:hypothetical protein